MRLWRQPLARSADWRCSWASWSRNSGSWSQRCKVRRPTLEKREAWAMGGDENGERRLLAWREAGVFYFRAVVSHCEPWPQWPFDRFGKVLIAAYQQRREWSHGGARAKCREFRTRGLLVFATTPVFPCTSGLSNGSPTSRPYGFPLSRERRVSGGMDSRSPAGAGDKLRGKDG